MFRAPLAPSANATMLRLHLQDQGEDEEGQGWGKAGRGATIGRWKFEEYRDIYTISGISRGGVY